MKQLILLATVAILAVNSAQGRPDQPQSPHHPPMVSQHETIVSITSSNSTEASTSVETTVDSMESAEDDNITVQAKTAPMCPPRQSDIVEIEEECTMEDKLKDPECTSQTPLTDMDNLEVINLTTEAPTTMAEDTTVIPTTESTTMETGMKHVQRHRKRTCNYHLCILRRLDVLDSLDMPDKDLLTTWAATNITDEKQKEKTQWKLQECIASLKDIFGETTDSSEEETRDENKGEDASKNRRKKSCAAAKKVIGCLSKSAECPVVKF